MILLQADARVITRNTKFSFLSDNELAGATALSIVSTSEIEADDYILIGEFGNETSEIRKISSIDNATQLTVTVATTFAHSESTKITRIIYNQVRFYRTTTPTFSAANVLSTKDIDAQSFFTTYEDYANGTGYGWFIFLNETTSRNSAPSNPIPYADFDPNSAKKIIDSFFSSLNNKEAKLITFNDAFRWLSEGYSIAYNELNLANQEYTTPTANGISVSSGTQEYELPDDFGKLVSVSDESGVGINKIKQRDIQEYKNLGSKIKYYIRGKYIGFVPVPTSSSTYYIYYNAKSGYLSSYYDNIVLPNNNYYCLHDFMMYRAAEKLSRSQPEKYYQRFINAINMMKLNSAKQGANPNSWDISSSSNV